MESLHANMFPAAPAGAPDLQDSDTPPAQSTSGFPAAPTASAFKHAGEAPEPKTTKAEIAMAYLKANGPTTREELAAHLGIKRDALSAYLVTAVKDGRIELGKTMAMLGTGKAAPKGRPPKVEQPAPAQPPKVEQPAPPEAEKPDPLRISASLTVGDLQLIAWADGACGIYMPGHGLVLNNAQLGMLCTFLELAKAAA